MLNLTHILLLFQILELLLLLFYMKFLLLSSSSISFSALFFGDSLIIFIYAL